MVMKRKIIWLFLVTGVLTLLAAIYVRTHPLVFNESMWGHAHCMPQATLPLLAYSSDHGGKFPMHPKGYGNALLLLTPYTQGNVYMLNGPGYDERPFHEAQRNGTVLSEEDCGRVYVQGLTMRSNPQIALLFDKIPSPGGDHCSFPMRIWAPLCRDVGLRNGSAIRVPETEWPEFASKQVELLVNEGISREDAERLYASQSRQQDEAH
jgi:hypothetical protein